MEIEPGMGYNDPEAAGRAGEAQGPERGAGQPGIPGGKIP